MPRKRTAQRTAPTVDEEEEVHAVLEPERPATPARGRHQTQQRNGSLPLYREPPSAEARGGRGRLPPKRKPHPTPKISQPSLHPRRTPAKTKISSRLGRSGAGTEPRLAAQEISRPRRESSNLRGRAHPRGRTMLRTSNLSSSTVLAPPAVVGIPQPPPIQLSPTLTWGNLAPKEKPGAFLEQKWRRGQGGLAGANTP